MTEPILFTRGLSVALVALLQALLPPIVAASSLYLLCTAYGVAFDRFFVVLAVLAALLSLLLPPGRLSERQFLTTTLPLITSVIVRWLIIVGVLLAIGYVTKVSEEYSRRVLLTWMVATPALLVLTTLCLHEVMRRLVYDPAMVRRAVFAGCNEISVSLARRVSSGSEYFGMKVEGFFDDRSHERLTEGLGAPPVRLLGDLSQVGAYVKRHRIDMVFVALPMRHIRRVMNLLDELRDTTASVYYVPDIRSLDLIQARTGEIVGVPVVALCETPFYGYRGVVKRITDIALASLMLLIAAPLMLGIAAMVRLSSPGPVIFRQRRYGLDGEEIVVFKFRTMTVSEDGERVVQATQNDVRVTPIGRVLRRYSLDELPQLINVLQGRMSLVGPRPHAVAHNEEYRKLIKGYMLRHKVPPGMTGLAQINGCRGETPRVEDMRARVQYDLEYLRRWTPLLDVKILLVTMVKLVRDELKEAAHVRQPLAADSSTGGTAARRADGR